MESEKDKTDSLMQSEGDTNNDNKKEEISTEEKKETKDAVEISKEEKKETKDAIEISKEEKKETKNAVEISKEEKKETKDAVEISPKENDDNKEVVSKEDSSSSPETVNDEDKKSDEEKISKNENTNEPEKDNSCSELSRKSSKSSIVIPKSILRKRKTDEDDENSESMTDESISSIKKKHIEFSDDNIVYTLEREEEYEEDEDDEAYRHQNYINKSLVNSIFVLIKRYLLFALVISAGFCFSYYSYNKNKKSYGGRQRTGGVIMGRNEQKALSFNWEKTTKVTETTTTTTTTTTKLIPIRSLTLTDAFTEATTAVEETTENVVSEKSNKLDQDKSASKNSESIENDLKSSKKKNKKGKKEENNKKKGKRDEQKFKRVVAIGDVHGDFKKFISILLQAKIINDRTDWIAKDTILVQTGDLIDRGPDTIPVFDLVMKLRSQAPDYNSVVYLLLGNHEVMNLQEDLRYVTRGDVMSFGSLESRRMELSMAGRYGRLLRQEMNSTMVIDDTLFVHAGLPYAYARAGTEQINNYVHYLLQNYPPEQLFYATIFGNDGPFWIRSFALDPEEYVCQELELVLQLMQAERMVIGHTVQGDGRINTRCNNKIVMIDVGLSAFYGGNFAYLEIFDDKKEVWAVYRNDVRERIN